MKVIFHVGKVTFLEPFNEITSPYHEPFNSFTDPAAVTGCLCKWQYTSSKHNMSYSTANKQFMCRNCTIQYFFVY